jgi:hypothetical protein
MKDISFKITAEGVRKVNNRMIQDSKFKKEHPILHKLKKYFEKPNRYKLKIEGANEESRTPNFYTDILGYKQTRITITKDDINNSYKRAREKI